VCGPRPAVGLQKERAMGVFNGVFPVLPGKEPSARARADGGRPVPPAPRHA